MHTKKVASVSPAHCDTGCYHWNYATKRSRGEQRGISLCEQQRKPGI